MPNRTKPARLVLRPARAGDRPALWVIIDRRREIGTSARAEERGKAEKALARYLDQRDQPPARLNIRDPDAILIADVLDEYQTERAGVGNRAIRIATAVLKLLEFFGAATLGTITPERCDSYVAWRTQQRDARAKHGPGRLISVQTARVELGTLKAAAQWRLKNGRLDRPVPVKMPPMGHARERHLTRAEAARLLAGALGFYLTGATSIATRVTVWRWRRDPRCINRHVARFILLGLYTATRHSAIRRLQWMPNTAGGWIDLDAQIIYRRAQRATDTAKRKPPLPMPARLLPHVRRWHGHGGRFLIEYDGEPIGPIRTAWEGARQLAHLGADVTPHILRHTCATWLLQAGETEWAVAGVLGCSPEIVRATYGHHARSGLRVTLDAFSARQRRS